MDDILPAADIDESARTSSRRSARSDRVEIITRSERRRWSLEQKREVVAESLGPGLTPTEVARKYAISSGQLYTWRRKLLSVQTSIIARATPRFAEVETKPAPPRHMAAQPAPAAAHPLCTSAAPPRPDGLIELVMPSGVVVRMDGGARHWAIAMTLIQTAKLNGVEPMAWLTDVLERIVSGQTKSNNLQALLPWSRTSQLRKSAYRTQSKAA